jgi:hypothetical protein
MRNTSIELPSGLLIANKAAAAIRARVAKERTKTSYGRTLQGVDVPVNFVDSPSTRKQFLPVPKATSRQYDQRSRSSMCDRLFLAFQGVLCRLT